MQFLEVCIKDQNRSTIFWKLPTDQVELSLVSVNGTARLHDCLSSSATKKLEHVARTNEGRTMCVLVVSSMFPNPISTSLVNYDGFGRLGFYVLYTSQN